MALTVLVTWFIARRLGLRVGDLAELGPEWSHPRWGLLLVATAVLLAGNFLSGALWGRMVLDLGGRRLPVWVAIRVFLVANLGRYVPGKLWQIAGLALLAARQGVPSVVSTAAAVLGHGVSLVAATLLGATVFLWWHPQSVVTSAWIPAGLVVALIIALLPPVFRRLVGVWARMARGSAPAETATPMVVVRWLALFMVNWIVYALAFVTLARSFGIPGAALEVGPAYVAAYVLGYVALFAPAGIGVREVALTGLLSPSVGAPAAAALAVIARVWTTLVEVLPGGILWARELSGRPDDPTRSATTAQDES